MLYKVYDKESLDEAIKVGDDKYPVAYSVCKNTYTVHFQHLHRKNQMLLIGIEADEKFNVRAVAPPLSYDGEMVVIMTGEGHGNVSLVGGRGNAYRSGGKGEVYREDGEGDALKLS